jgi:UDP-3-O-[3-hydroxymyristoyl] glucosamine N-acyltransferase
MKFSKTHSLKEIATIIDCQYIGADDFPVEGMKQGIT